MCIFIRTFELKQKNKKKNKTKQNTKQYTHKKKDTIRIRNCIYIFVLINNNMLIHNFFHKSLSIPTDITVIYIHKSKWFWYLISFTLLLRPIIFCRSFIVCFLVHHSMFRGANFKVWLMVDNLLTPSLCNSLSR